MSKTMALSPNSSPESVGCQNLSASVDNVVRWRENRAAGRGSPEPALLDQFALGLGVALDAGGGLGGVDAHARVAVGLGGLLQGGKGALVGGAAEGGAGDEGAALAASLRARACAGGR